MADYKGELERLRSEVAEIRDARKSDLERFHQERLDTRKMPPMAQMTRMQKRYFLEPWMTTLSVGFGSLAVVAFMLGIFTPLHVEFSMLGILFVLVTVASVVTKLNLMEWNSKSEGQIQARRYDNY